jgi:protocatechuate 3,4-dioxygenase beta subunit
MLFQPRLFTAVALACFALVMSGAATGQATTSLRGTVTDPTGSAIAGARVVLANNESKTERTATTGDQGGYQFLLLSPGTYRLTVTATGFQH